MRGIVLFAVIVLGWFGYKEITALRKCAIRRNFSHPTAAAVFNFVVKLISGSVLSGTVALGMIMVYNWDLTSQLVTRILVNLFH